jgi:ribosomal protein L37AE/L43A
MGMMYRKRNAFSSDIQDENGEWRIDERTVSFVWKCDYCGNTIEAEDDFFYSNYA